MERDGVSSSQDTLRCEPPLEPVPAVTDQIGRPLPFVSGISFPSPCPDLCPPQFISARTYRRTQAYTLISDAHTILARHAYYVLREELAPNMSVIFATDLSLTTAYSRSDTRRPAAILSVTHSGRTTCTMCFDLVVRNFCVFVPLNCWDVRMCVAPDAVCLCNTASPSASSQTNAIDSTYVICPPASVTMRFISMSVVLSKYPLM